MKTRTGFVSNSSSSSFIVAVKGNLKTELAKLEKKEKKSNGLFSSLISEAVAVIETTCEDFNEQDVLDCYGHDTIEEFYSTPEGKRIKKLQDDGFKVYTGSWSDDGGEPIEAVLCNTDFNYKSKTLVIIHDGGY